ncbi:MAG: hypothetical protein ACI8XB_002215 [Patiriisocius sp.]|jgi:hypothetical protein
MKSILILVGFFSCNVHFTQDVYNQFYVNPYRESGSGSVGTGVEVMNDTIYVFTRIVDTDLLTIGYMLKYDFSGEIIDSVRFTSLDSTMNVDLGEFGNAFKENGNFILPMTEYNSDPTDQREFSLLNIQTSGSQNWKKNINVDSTKVPFYRKTLKFNDGYAVIGHISDSIFISSYEEVLGLLTHTDIEGNLLWYQTYENISELLFASPTSDGGLLLGGNQYLGIPGNSHDHVIIKVDNLGYELWRNHFGGDDGNGPLTPVIELMDNSYLAFGTHLGLEDFGFVEGPFWAKKYNIEGVEIDELEWDFRDTGKNFRGVKQLEDTDLVFIGFNGEYLGEDGPGELEWSHNQGYVAKLSQDLDSIWSHFYTIDASIVPGGFDDMRDFEIMPDGGFIITGTIHRASNDTLYPGATQMWLMRLDEYGCLEPGCQYVGIEELTIGLENTMLVYPNPVVSGNEINIRFSPQGTGEMPYIKDETQLAVYDALGREVHRQRIPSQGSNDAFEVRLKVAKLASGTYSIQWFNAGPRGIGASSSTSSGTYDYTNYGGVWFDGVQVVVE